MEGGDYLSFDVNFVSLHLHISLVAADAGIKAKPCSLCSGKSGDSFIKSSTTTNCTEMPDSSHSYSFGEWRQQAVSTLQIFVATAL